MRMWLPPFCLRMLTINGNSANEAVGVSLEAYLAAHGYDKSSLAVERNNEIVPKAEYSRTILQDGDTVEIVQFVGGG